ncbi:K(+) efflux antiporter 3, chloroplastic [Tanacetum coccineum]
MVEAIASCHAPMQLLTATASFNKHTLSPPCGVGHDLIFKPSIVRSSHHSPHLYRHLYNGPNRYYKVLHKQAFSTSRRIQYSFHTAAKLPDRTLLLPSSFLGGKRFIISNHRHFQRGGRFRMNAALDVGGAVEVINDLGLDTLTFLAVTVLVVPAFKFVKASPILGFFSAGVVLNQFGLIRNLTDVKVLSEWGILFLVVLCTLAFTAFELPPNGAIGTRILEFLFHSRSDLVRNYSVVLEVNIRSIDEAVVIGAALSLSSSAFVLQLLAEKGELPTRFGSATLGILLLQDIAVVPLLVILPVLETQNLVGESILPMLNSAAETIDIHMFQAVAEARSSEAFVALCLLTVAGTSLITQKLGFSDTLGAFLAGALLAETNFRTQIEADIRPFRGLLLGLFFVTTGTSIDTQLLIREWPNVLSLLAGLIVIKTLIITAIGPRVGLTLQESVRIGLLLSQGGEFGFVVFSLANRLRGVPLELNKLLIIVVVLSMRSPTLYSTTLDERLLILLVKMLMKNFLSTPLATGIDGEAGWPFVAFNLDPFIVKASSKLGFPILYGDGSRAAVLQSAGISSPKAVMVMYEGRQRAVEAVERIRLAFPAIPIYARAQDIPHLLDKFAARVKASERSQCYV